MPPDDGRRERDSARPVREWAREEGLEPYDQATGEGYLRHLVVREGRNTGQALVLLVTAPGERFEAGYLVDVLRRFPEVRSVYWAINDTPAERTNSPRSCSGVREAIEEEILGLRFRIRPGAFLQTNTEMAGRLYSLALEYAALTGEENVLDLYCGTGTIALALARDAAAVGASRSPRRRSRARSRTPSSTASRTRTSSPGTSGRPSTSSSRSPAPGRRGRRPAPGRPRREGAQAHRRTRREDRLRLLQPDDARLGHPGHAGRVRATSLPPGRHVPARRTSSPSRCSSGRARAEHSRTRRGHGRRRRCAVSAPVGQGSSVHADLGSERAGVGVQRGLPAEMGVQNRRARRNPTRPHEVDHRGHRRTRDP